MGNSVLCHFQLCKEPPYFAFVFNMLLVAWLSVNELRQCHTGNFVDKQKTRFRSVAGVDWLCGSPYLVADNCAAVAEGV